MQGCPQCTIVGKSITEKRFHQLCQFLWSPIPNSGSWCIGTFKGRYVTVLK